MMPCAGAMLVAWAALVGPGAPARDALALYRGLPVLSVEIEGPASENVGELQKLIEIQPGYLLSTEAVQTALKRLYALGRFADVAVYAERLSGAVILRFQVKPSLQLEGLEVETSGKCDCAGLPSALRAAAGTEVDRRTASRLTGAALAFLARVGFPEANVVVKEEVGKNGGAAFLVQVHEGEPRRIRAVHFTGRVRVGEHVLRAVMLSREGDILNTSVLQTDRDRLLEAYRTHGFPEVRVEPAEVRTSGRDAWVNFQVDAGDRIAYFFTGQRLLTAHDLESAWPSPFWTLQLAELPAFMERIEEAYQRLGYVNARASFRSYPERRAGIVRVLITIDEGESFYVSSLAFPGAKVFPEELLVRQVHGVLGQELTQRTVFQPLNRFELAAAAQKPLPGLSVLVPERRWVPELYERAIEEITAAYKNRGYLNAKVGPMQLTITGREVRVQVPIVEGPQTLVRALSFRGNASVASADLLALLEQAGREAAEEGAAEGSDEGAPRTILPGRPLSHAALEDARINLVRRYRNDGYLYARVTSSAEVASDGEGAEVVFAIEEGPQVRIENVLVRGNRNTDEGLIRSRMSLVSGDLYRLEQALMDQRSIAALGVFSSVRVKLIDEEAPAERKDVVADVVERNRQSVEVWPGVSTADGPRLRVDYMHLNIGGSGSSANLSLKVNWKVFFSFYGEYAQQLEDRYSQFSLRERTEIQARAGIRSPRMLTLPLDPLVRFDLVGERDNAIPYSLDAGRAIFGLELVPARRWTLTIEPQAALTNLHCYAGVTDATGHDCLSELSQREDTRRIDEGLRATLRVGPSITYEGRDDAFNPRRGIYANLRAIFALGWKPREPTAASTAIASEDWSTFSFTKVEGTVSGYVPMFKKGVVALTARAGAVVRGAAPIDERFYLGGSTTLRGFQEDTLLPEDLCVRGDGDHTRTATCTDVVHADVASSTLAVSGGGNYFVLAKAEMMVPLSEQLIFAMFVDAGDLWLSKPKLEYLAVRITPGIGLRYATPAGPIGVDLGVNPNPNALRGESRVALQFAVGVF